MFTAFEKLLKILKLERSQGYHNKAVIGGFEASAQIWRAEALLALRSMTIPEAQRRGSAGSPGEQVADEETALQVNELADLFAGYEEADPSSRAQTVSAILARLDPVHSASHSTALQGLPSPPDSMAGVRPGDPSSSQEARPAAFHPPASRQPAAGGPPVGRPPHDLPFPAPPSSSLRSPSTGLDAAVSTLPGIAAGYAERLQRLGIATVGDLIYHFPHRYDDYSTLKPINRLEYGEETTIIGVVWETSTRKGRGGSAIVRSIIADASGTIEAVWFNQPYLASQLRGGRRIVLSGKVTERLGRLTLQSPAWEPLESELIHTGRLVPIYPLTRGISSRWMRRLLKRVVDHWAPRLEDHLPESVRQRQLLMALSTAILQIHFPDSLKAAEEARRRLSFDEFLLIQLGMLRQREAWRGQEATPIAGSQAQTETFIQSLPFQLTAAQRHSLDQVLEDLAQPRPMSRLLQGDVGSGKTVVAAGAMLMAVEAGKQASLMAPTEILAEQHHRTIMELVRSGDWGLNRPVSVALLTGSLRRAARSEVITGLASGKVDIVVGTQALIQRHVTFSDLALVVVDEQHRFGVAQRATLRGKGSSPHVLVMSATPIPRSLALTVYGDLDISVIDELPPGRQPIETRWLLPRERERAYAFLRSQIEKGRQAFILYPLIEESDKLQVRAAVEEYERLQKIVFPDLRLGLLHGRMRGSEKDGVMNSFRQGEINVLVSTSVIEVGIDVPNASVMLIEGADRFGLAQLHQFRGRVGRGAHKSFCLLISDAASPDDPQTRSTWERLKAIEETLDGFVLAEKDLEMRGPGDFFGVRQSGLPALRLASLTNLQTIEQAREEAKAIFHDDPELASEGNRLLGQQVARLWQGFRQGSDTRQGDLS